MGYQLLRPWIKQVVNFKLLFSTNWELNRKLGSRCPISKKRLGIKRVKFILLWTKFILLWKEQIEDSNNINVTQLFQLLRNICPFTKFVFHHQSCHHSSPFTSNLHFSSDFGPTSFLFCRSSPLPTATFSSVPSTDSRTQDTTTVSYMVSDSYDCQWGMSSENPHLKRF